jgi:hypothetical protein
VPLDHAGINAAVGAAGDPTGETAAIMSFIGAVTDEIDAAPPRATIKHHPAKRIVTSKRRVQVSFTFASTPAGARFQCRLDSAGFSGCRSPRAYRVGAGRHSFAVRAGAGDAVGRASKFEFQVLRRHR